MSSPRVTVVIPTLGAGAALDECIGSLERQTFRDFEIVVVDNGGRGLAKACGAVVIENERNVGFGAAINQGIRRSTAPYLAALNDDAVAHPAWLEALVAAMEARDDVGMCASQVRLHDSGRLDSAGMLIAGDGSSKQRGHGETPAAFEHLQEVLLPSGSAALYRRAMLDETGGFDESFFLYCEDTDLGLRARWRGWECLYVPDAVVEHGYSQTAGAASGLKAYYVERNRLFLIAKNFPAGWLLRAPFCALARYAWHIALALRGRGKAAEFARGGGSVAQLATFVLRAHWELLRNLNRLRRQRREIQRTRRLNSRQFAGLLRRYSITSRQVAAQ